MRGIAALVFILAAAIANDGGSEGWLIATLAGAAVWFAISAAAERRHLQRREEVERILGELE